MRGLIQYSGGGEKDREEREGKSGKGSEAGGGEVLGDVGSSLSESDSAGILKPASHCRVRGSVQVVGVEVRIGEVRNRLVKIVKGCRVRVRGTIRVRVGSSFF